MIFLVLSLSLFVSIRAAEAARLPEKGVTLDEAGRPIFDRSGWQKSQNIRKLSGLAKRADKNDDWLNMLLQAHSSDEDWSNSFLEAPSPARSEYPQSAMGTPPQQHNEQLYSQSWNPLSPQPAFHEPYVLQHQPSSTPRSHRDEHLAGSKEGTNMQEQDLRSSDVTPEGSSRYMTTQSDPSWASHFGEEGHGGASSSRKTIDKGKMKSGAGPEDKKTRYNAKDCPLLRKESLLRSLAAHNQSSQLRPHKHLLSEEERKTIYEEALLECQERVRLRCAMRAAEEKRASELFQRKNCVDDIDDIIRRELNTKLNHIRRGDQKGTSWDIKETILTEQIAEITGEKGEKLMENYQKVLPIIKESWRREPVVLTKLDQNPLKMDAKTFVTYLVKRLEREAG
ncbi:hypothetical protein FA10DRAFT_262769 [Acaromyces ingoldii]|uniref:Uncharacterized protein n=1 Tax=Acaromyces ingoldii TaxID=215250 RepID=A0A316YCI9_9BASI|nr:hypothetical protein FA10DRAFT_262769 [Acaromyces ingoldii]PWN86972.1 hypothetical protein FA10DRAFT_262769 [Acaromyces ingoldii]